MRSLVIAALALCAIACDVSIEIRDKPAQDAGALVEASPAAEAPGDKPAAGTEAKPAPKERSLGDELDDVWNKVEREGREAARDAEKKLDEIRKDVDVKVDKKEISAESLYDRYGWILWAIGFVILIGVVIAILDALDLFGGIFEMLGEALGTLVEVLVKAAVAVAKGIGSLAMSAAKALRKERRRDPDPPPKPPRERDLDREEREAEARLNDVRLRKQRRDLNEARIDPFRGTPPEPPRRAKRDSDDGLELLHDGKDDLDLD